VVLTSAQQINRSFWQALDGCVIKVMPTLMILLSVGSSVVYGFSGDIRLTIYWAAAAVLTASVTY
jgi:hypothetical protein